MIVAVSPAFRKSKSASLIAKVQSITSLGVSDKFAVLASKLIKLVRFKPTGSVEPPSNVAVGFVTLIIE